LTNQPSVDHYSLLQTEGTPNPDISTKYLEEVIKSASKDAAIWTQAVLKRGHIDDFDFTDKGVYLQLEENTKIVQYIPRLPKFPRTTYAEQATRMMNDVARKKISPTLLGSFMRDVFERNKRKGISPWKIIKIVK